MSGIGLADERQVEMAVDFRPKDLAFHENQVSYPYVDGLFAAKEAQTLDDVVVVQDLSDRSSKEKVGLEICCFGDAVADDDADYRGFVVSMSLKKVLHGHDLLDFLVYAGVGNCLEPYL